jgi:hypothetical protein
LEAIAQLRPLLHTHDYEGVAPQVDAWEAHALAALRKRPEALSTLSRLSQGGGRWPHMAVRTDLATGRALALLGCHKDAVRTFERSLSVAEANGYRLYQLEAHHELARSTDAAPAKARHQRVAKALARSLAANLTKNDAARFLSSGWGEPLGDVSDTN